MKESKILVFVNDLDFEIKDVAFEIKIFNKYGTCDQILNMMT
jgi:hypothetical protein